MKWLKWLYLQSSRKTYWLIIGRAIINAASAKQELRVCILKSNTILKPAITLYEKLGFKRIVGRPSPYERVNIQMALDLEEISG